MVEKYENLIVKVGKVIPQRNEKINHVVLNEWKQYVQEYFQTSPNVYMIENEFY